MYLRRIISILAITLIITGCNKSEDDGGDSGSDVGSLTFYINEAFPCYNIVIELTSPSGNVSRGELRGNSVVTGVPDCDVPNTFTFLNLPYGVYQISYTCGDRVIDGEMTVNQDCFPVLMIN
jgi:hypothetical protein